MAGRKGMARYPKETKYEAVRLFLEESKTRAEIAQILGLNCPDLVKFWVRKYREDKDAFEQPIGRPPKKNKGVESIEEELQRLRMENDLLKKFHAELRKEELAKRNIGQSITKNKTTK